MMMDNGNGTFTAGGLDVLCILYDVTKNTYHAAFFEEHPMPGEVKSIEETDIVRLKSKMHHTGYCQKCDKYRPRARVRHLNRKKQKLEKIRKKEMY